MTGGLILVTGAAGLIGGRLARRLGAEGAAVIATDRQVVEPPRACAGRLSTSWMVRRS